MFTQSPHRERSHRAGEFFRSFVERFARLLMGEPFALVPRRQVERLRQLERREELRLAERRGDDDFLDRELTKAQHTTGNLSQSAARTTPISEWPDENLDDCFCESAEPKEPH